MKKFIIGLVSGIALVLSVNVYADEIESYIGKVIEGQFPVVIDGERTDKPGIVVDGTTYIPIRSAGELFGYDVSFIDSQVMMKSRSEKEVNEPVIRVEIREEPSVEPEKQRLMKSPMGNEFDFNKIGLRGIENQLRIVTNREWVFSASEVESAREELPLLREEIEFWEEIKAMKEKESEK